MDELELVRPAVSESDGIELSITVEGKWDVHEHDFDVYIRLTIRFMAEGADEETAPLEEDALRLTIVYAVTYHSEGEIRSDMLDQFGQTSARLVLWPYLREVSQSALARAGQPGFLLPVFSTIA